MQDEKEKQQRILAQAGDFISLVLLMGKICEV